MASPGRNELKLLPHLPGAYELISYLKMMATITITTGLYLLSFSHLFQIGDVSVENFKCKIHFSARLALQVLLPEFKDIAEGSSKDTQHDLSVRGRLSQSQESLDESDKIP